MKTIGLIGGMSWESTAIYYRLINEIVRQRIGGLHSAKLILWSFDFDEIVNLQAAENWGEASKRMIGAGNALRAAGAQGLLICTNTMHKMADEVLAQVQLPVLHIVDVTAEAIKQSNLKKVGLLATKFTMEQPFYTERLKNLHDIETILPNDQDRVDLHNIIFNELCQGIIRSDSKKCYLNIIDKLVSQGAQAIILGCTEICLLIQQSDISIPVFDTTQLHAQAAVNWALK